MLCEKCGTKLKIKDSRSLHHHDTIEGYGSGHLLKRVGKIIVWYTQDFTARRRSCPSCTHSFDSIELEVKDFLGCLQAIANDDEIIEKIKEGKFDG